MVKHLSILCCFETQLLNDRDETERQLLNVTQELTIALNQQQQVGSMGCT